MFQYAQVFQYFSIFLMPCVNVCSGMIFMICGLQIRVHRFNSGTRLHLKTITYITPCRVWGPAFTGAFTFLCLETVILLD